MKILIAVPTFETIMPETFKSIYELDTIDAECNFDFVKGYDCAKARNAIVCKALSGGYDYVLMVDSDIILPPDTLLHFLNEPADICFGVYPHKNTTNGKAEIFKPGTDNFELRFSYKELKTDRIKVKGAGFGCAFVSTDVFRKMQYPYFRYVINESGSALSEDLYFCDVASKIGYDLWADTRIKCGHLAKYFQYE